jgi:hypothetical protein
MTDHNQEDQMTDRTKPEPIGEEHIAGAMAGFTLSTLITGAKGKEWAASMGVDWNALKEASDASARDEFEHKHAAGELAQARLSGQLAPVSDEQRKAIHDAVSETFGVAFLLGCACAYYRMGHEPGDVGL